MRRDEEEEHLKAEMRSALGELSLMELAPDISVLAVTSCFGRVGTALNVLPIQTPYTYKVLHSNQFLTLSSSSEECSVLTRCIASPSDLTNSSKSSRHGPSSHTKHDVSTSYA